jgi:hypothetical protein
VKEAEQKFDRVLEIEKATNSGCLSFFALTGPKDRKRSVALLSKPGRPTS